MKKLLFISLLFFTQSLIAQMIPIKTKGTTRALVVGISDYQSVKISDLKYAHKDAEAFAQFLTSEAGYGLPRDQVLLLTNENATAAQFDNGMNWLQEESKEGDQAIIYFSGHGDVETRTRRKLGFLLCWDTPPQSYQFGSMPVYWFNIIIETLILDNKASVIVITDACRAGKLAGNEINGSQITNANLAKIVDNEIKILSCQPDELSLEGEQWGGGRGAFSYHLIEGLYGLADSDSDLRVTLRELDRYLEDRVYEEANQIPMVQGNRTTVLGYVDEKLKQKLVEAKSSIPDVFASVDSKGIEEEILSELDDTTKEKYENYKLALSKKYFFDWSMVDKGNLTVPADDLFREFSQDDRFSNIHNHLRRNYAAALQDDAQQFYNSVLKGDFTTVGTTSLITDDQRLRTYPLQLERAAELLGSEHYFYKNLKAKQEYFRAISAWLQMPFVQDKEKGKEILDHLNKSLEWEPESAQTYTFIAFLHSNNLNDPDSAVYYANKAHEMSPSWVLPYVSLADVFYIQGKNQLAEDMVNKAWNIDSTSVLVLNTKAKIMARKGNSAKAEKLFLSAIATEPGWSVPYKNLAFEYLKKGKLPEAEVKAKKALDLNSNELRAMQVLGWVYMYTDREELGEETMLKVLELDEKVILNVNFDLGCIQARKGKIESAYYYIEEALKLGYSSYTSLHTDDDLIPLRTQQDRWHTLMKKYFPDQKEN